MPRICDEFRQRNKRNRSPYPIHVQQPMLRSKPSFGPHENRVKPVHVGFACAHHESMWLDVSIQTKMMPKSQPFAEFRRKQWCLFETKFEKKKGVLNIIDKRRIIRVNFIRPQLEYLPTGSSLSRISINLLRFSKRVVAITVCVTSEQAPPTMPTVKKMYSCR